MFIFFNHLSLSVSSSLFQFMSDPVSIAVANTQFDIVKEEGLQENALEVGTYLMSKLRVLKDKHPCIGDVR